MFRCGVAIAVAIVRGWKFAARVCRLGAWGTAGGLKGGVGFGVSVLPERGRGLHRVLLTRASGRFDGWLLF